MDWVFEILEIRVGQSTVYDFVVALVLFVALLIFFRYLKRWLLSGRRSLVHKTRGNFDDELINTVEGISAFFYFVVALYFPLRMLVAEPGPLKWINGIFLIVLTWEAIRFLRGLIEYAIRRVAVKKNGEGPEAEATFYGLSLIIRIVLWSMGLLLVLSNLGVNVTSLVASLGIGGVAIALAVQNILGDVFSSFSIYFDKPFQVGDFITVGQDKGTVKKIGLKTTRLQALQGEELVISNSELTTSRVQNFKRMKKRRGVLNLGIIYDTDLGKVKKINSIIENVMNGVDLVEFDRSHFKEFGELALNFEVIYYVDSPDYKVFMDKQQEINYGIKEVFEKEGIEMAYPTKTLHVMKG